MKNKCFCLTFSTFWGLPQQPVYYVWICKYAKLKFREADKCDITVLLYRKPLIFGFKWGTKGTFSPCAKSRNTMCSPCASDVRQSCVCGPCFLWKSALLLSLNLLSFHFLGSVLLLWVALPPVKKAFPAARFLRWQSYFFTAPRSVVYWSSQYSCRHCSIFFLYSAGENPVTCLNCREKNFSSS